MDTQMFDKELIILRNAIDNADKKISKTMAQSKSIKKIIDIVEKFIIKQKLICYGGTAINNILPLSDQFYNKEFEIPDYDFFSNDAINDAKKLADIYYKSGFEDVEAKAGIHIGTYKVFVNFIPIADITQMNNTIFNNMKKDQIIVNKIAYAPPNYLRMAAYLELSRPAGDISRWEKVLKRINLLNKHYPITRKRCDTDKFINKFENKELNKIYNNPDIFNIIKNTSINLGLVFFGGFALSLYGKYISDTENKLLSSNPIFDLLARDAKVTTERIVNILKNNNYKNITYIKVDNIDEIIPLHYIIKIDDKIIAFIYQTIACHSYNVIYLNNKFVKIATIDTMLSLYLAFIYSDKDYYNTDRILCFTEYLFRVQSRNRFKQKGVLKRFSIKCYGQQDTLQNIRANKSSKFKELKNNRTSPEFEKYFLRYIPSEIIKKTNKKSRKTNKKSRKTNKKSRKTNKKSRKTNKKSRKTNKKK